MFREIIGRVMLCVIWSGAVVYADKYLLDVNISSVLHSLVGSALGLLLVFRTNASYDRFWEGRKLWGGIVNETRNLVRGAVTHLAADRDAVVRLAELTSDFALATMQQLRGAPMRGWEDAQHPPMAIATEMTGILRDAHRKGWISDVTMASLDLNIQQLVDYLGGCERIRKTPLPFAYVVHLRRALVLYCFSLPFALVDSFGWATVFDTLLVAYIFFGIEEIGVEIEGPFGFDDNDLPLEEIHTSIRHTLFALAGMEKSEREALPEGL